MNYVVLIVLAIAVIVGLYVKYLAAKLIVRKSVSTAKAKLIAEMFSFNPLDILLKLKFKD